MHHYLLMYDLHRVRNYPKLYELLEMWKAERLHESTWLATLVGPAHEVLLFIAQYIDGDDSASVIEITSDADWATLRSMAGGRAKLKQASPPTDVTASPAPHNALAPFALGGFAPTVASNTIVGGAVMPPFNALRRR